MAKASVTVRACSCCMHAERLTIDHLMAMGADGHAVARRFGLGKDAPRRHFQNHVSEIWAAAIKISPYSSRAELEKLCLEEGASVLQGLRALYASHHAILVANREAGATNAYLATAREMRATLNDIGRLTGELLPSVANLSVTNNFNSVTYLIEVAEDLATEAADHPEALAILQRVLRRRMNAALPAPDVLQGEARLVA